MTGVAAASSSRGHLYLFTSRLSQRPSSSPFPARAGTKRAALIVPQPLARSKPLVAGKPATVVSTSCGVPQLDAQNVNELCPS